MESPTSAAAIRVLLIDDHPILRQGVASLLTQRPGLVVVAEGDDGAQALDLYRRHRPDVVLMDVRMPGVDGVAALKALRAEFPGARVLLFTSFDTDEDVYAGMQAGALGYLLKTAPPAELVEALRSVHAGRRHVPPAIGARLADRVMTGDLTEREIEVLREVARGRNNQEIARALFISEGTVKFHVNRILAKMGCQDRTQALIAGVKRGLVRIA